MVAVQYHLVRDISAEVRSKSHMLVKANQPLDFTSVAKFKKKKKQEKKNTDE